MSGDDQISYEEPREYARKVKALVRSGTQAVDICKYLGITSEQLFIDYSDIMHTALIDRNIEVAQKVYDIAMEGNLTACQFWLKNLGKWEEYSKTIPEIRKDDVFEAIKIQILPGLDIETD